MRGRSSVNLWTWRDYPHRWDEGKQAVWEVDHRPDQERVSCWQIPFFEERKSTCGYLVMKAVRGNGNDGGEITLAISDTPRYDVYAQDVLATVPAQGGVQRKYVYRSRWERE